MDNDKNDQYQVLRKYIKAKTVWISIGRLYMYVRRCVAITTLLTQFYSFIFSIWYRSHHQYQVSHEMDIQSSCIKPRFMVRRKKPFKSRLFLRPGYKKYTLFQSYASFRIFYRHIGPDHVGPMNLAIRDDLSEPQTIRIPNTQMSSLCTKRQ